MVLVAATQRRLRDLRDDFAFGTAPVELCARRPAPPDPAAVAAIGGLCEANARLATSFGDLVRRSPRGQVTEENRDARIGYLREALDGVRAARSSFTTATPGPPVVNNVRISYVRGLTQSDEELTTRVTNAPLLVPRYTESATLLTIVDLTAPLPDGPGIDTLRTNPQTASAYAEAPACR